MTAMDAEFTKWLVTLGVGGILAAFMFTFYRKDVKQYTELWRAATDQLMNVVKDCSTTNSKLITMLENIERNAIRKSDIEALRFESRATMRESMIRDESRQADGEVMERRKG